MRVLLLTTLLITACLPEDEVSISQSGDVKRRDLTNKNDPAYIEQGECLIDIGDTLELGKRIELPQPGQCLPSSKLSWLFRAREVKKQAKQRLKLAVLLDTSESLRDNDALGDRYTALRTYLLALFDKINNTDKGADALVTTAEVQIYPFKYCDSRKDKTLKLTITRNKSKDDFTKEVDQLIGAKETYAYIGEAEDVRQGRSFSTLTKYGAVGSTNYLHSLAQAIEFFNSASDNDLKQVLIFSDGLPFTFNDGTANGANNTIDLDAAGCNVGHEYGYPELRAKLLTGSKFSPKDGIKACVTDAFYPKNTCQRPTANNLGQTNTGTNEPYAWSDPLNHVLGMVQHEAIISKAKEGHNFQVYAVLLRPSNCNTIKSKWDKTICQEITTHLAKPFFESFASHYEETSKAAELAKKLKATLDAQIQKYRKHGTAYLNTADKGSDTTVDSKTTLYTGNLIKVGRDKQSNDLDYDNKDDGVYDYANAAQNTLMVKHGLYGYGGSFEINYDFTFSSTKDGSDCRSADNSKIGNLEVNKYGGNGYTAWCLLSPRCDTDDQCCDPRNNYRILSDQEGQQLCAAKDGKWLWVGFKDKQRVCDCVCNPADEAACQGKGQSWNANTCTCEQGAVIEPEQCVPSETVCCKGGKAYTRQGCESKAGEVWDESSCSCVQETLPPTQPTQRACDPSRECCDGDTVVAQGTCANSRQVWRGFDANNTANDCRCVCRNSASSCNSQTHNWQGFPDCACVPNVVPPTDPSQTGNGTVGGNEGNQGKVQEKPENPEKAGKEQGGIDGEPTVSEGMVWGAYESF